MIYEKRQSQPIEDPNKPYTLSERKVISLLEEQNKLLEELIKDIDRIHGEVETIRLRL